ncbi:hypothetical protein B0T21DRAFT_380353 [Apiosordaria backusii]|uniref:Uncharacterized protein n=1 Tax=Apiosordaria backusii TaxID=314023 RepID=A0AA40F057_9PEZI|nr:hypothetical protein B0T21DRAFT_380353 [Apiosordaria backusii]
MHSFSQATALAAATLATIGLAQSHVDIFREAIRKPNATRSIRFNPYPDVRHLADLEWTWRVNISDSLSNPYDNRSTEFTVRTSYDFTYEGAPTDSTLEEAVPGLGNQSFCAVQLIWTDSGWPANITNLWTDENTNSTSCAPVLGQDCVDAIIQSTGTNNGAWDRTCGSQGGSWERAPQCASSLGYMYSLRRVSAKNFPKLNNANSGESFAGLSSMEYSDLDNKTIYENYLNSIHMVLINAPVDLIRGNQSSFSTDAPTKLLCMRVNTSRRDVNEDEGDGNDGDDGGNQGGNEGGNGGDGGNAAGRDAANWWTMIGGLMIAAVIGAAL